MLVGGHGQTQEELDAGKSVGAIADLLRQNPAGLNMEVHVYAEFVTSKQEAAGREPRIKALGGGQAYADIQGAFARGIRKWAVLGYSHGGGLTYQFADRIDAGNSLVDPTRLGFSGYIDAIQRNVSHGPGPILAETRRPKGSLYHYNMYEINSSWGIRRKSMGAAADAEQKRTYNDDMTKFINHVSIPEQPSIHQFFRALIINKLQQIV